MKRKTSEPKVSKWIPLWKNYYGKGYISPVIKTSDLKALEQGTRIRVCHDKFHTKDSNRPYLQMQFVNSAAHDEKMVQELYWDAIKDARKGYIEPQEVITLKDACEITRGLLYDMEYGYSMDDLTVEPERFMKDRSFTAIEYNDEDLEDVSRFF